MTFWKQPGDDSALDSYLGPGLPILSMRPVLSMRPGLSASADIIAIASIDAVQTASSLLRSGFTDLDECRCANPLQRCDGALIFWKWVAGPKRRYVTKIQI